MMDPDRGNEKLRNGTGVRRAIRKLSAFCVADSHAIGATLTITLRPDEMIWVCPHRVSLPPKEEIGVEFVCLNWYTPVNNVLLLYKMATTERNRLCGLPGLDGLENVR